MTLPSALRPLIARARRVASYLTTGWRRRALTALFVILTIGVIAGIIADNWTLLTEYEWQFRPAWFIVAIFFFLLDLFLALWAWQLLVVRLPDYRNLRRSVKIVLQSNLARRIPGSVWYVASRAVLYEEEGVSKTAVSLLSGLELAFFMISGVLTTLLTLPFWSLPQELFIVENPFVWVLFILPLGVVFVHPRVLSAVWRRMSPEAPGQQLRWQDTLTWMLVYLMTWLLGGIVLFCVLNVFQTMPLSRLVNVIGIWALANTISLVGFVTISLFGLREVSLTVLLAPLLPTPIALIVAITIRLIWLTGELVTSLISLRL